MPSDVAAWRKHSCLPRRDSSRRFSGLHQVCHAGRSLICATLLLLSLLPCLSAQDPPPADQPINSPAPPKEQTFPITPPRFSDPLEFLWYGIAGLSGISFLALAFTAWKLKRATEPDSSALTALGERVQALGNQAMQARKRYDELSKRAASPVPAPAAVLEPVKPITHRSQPEPQEPPRLPDPEPEQPRVRSGPGPRINKLPRAGPPPAELPAIPRDDLVDAYQMARSRTDGSARDRFDSQFPYIRISCTNIEDWQFHKNVTLTFEKQDFGWYLMVNRGGKCLALPWFTHDLASERESFKGVFNYPEWTGEARLRIVKPAVLQPQGDGWILATPGEVRADA